MEVMNRGKEDLSSVSQRVACLNVFRNELDSFHSRHTPKPPSIKQHSHNRLRSVGATILWYQIGSVSSDPHSLLVHKFQQSLTSTLLSVSRAFHSTKCQLRRTLCESIDKCHSALQLLCHISCFLNVLREDCSPQSILIHVGQFNSMVSISAFDDADHWSKKLLVEYTHAAANVGQNSWRVVESSLELIVAWNPTPSDKACPLLESILHLDRKFVPQITPCKGPNICIVLKRISHFQFLHLYLEALQEFIVNILLNNETFGSNARLSVVENSTSHTLRDGQVHVCILEHNEWIRSTKFQYVLLDVSSCLSCNHRTYLGRTGECNPLHSWIGNNFRHSLIVHKEYLERILWEGDLLKQLSNGESTLWNRV
mmetsp:Transcript_1691/g.5930  ORF Transcript_1691/g.5930 Transcript_1691/m.5930 type:complete len:369 (+) Transcript_1691:402-1508(+)